MTPHSRRVICYALIFVPSFFFDMQKADSAMFFFPLKNPTVCSAMLRIVLNQEDLFVIGDDELDKLKNSEIALEIVSDRDRDSSP